MKTSVLPAEDGSVPKSDVLHVLRSVSPALQLSLKISGEDSSEITIVKDGVPEVFLFTDERIPRKMLHRLDKKYGFNIEFFFHPEMCCSGSEAKN